MVPVSVISLVASYPLQPWCAPTGTTPTTSNTRAMAAALRVNMCRRLPRRPVAGLTRVDQHRHVAVGVLVLEHQLVTLGNVVVRIGVAEARVHLALRDEPGDVRGLRVVGEMAALEALLAHPVIAQVHGRGVAGRAGADDDHAARRAHQDRRGQSRLAQMLEDDPWAHALARAVPDRLAERPGALRPFAVGLGLGGVRHRAPVRELAAVDHRRGAVLLTEFLLCVVGDHCHRAPAEGTRDLERHATEPARRAPYEDDIPRLDDVGWPAHEHPVRVRGAEQEAPGFFPGEAPGLGNALMGLAARELAEASVVGLVAPDACALGEHRVLARPDPWIVGAPPSAVHDDLVADLDVLHVASDGPDDSRAVAAPGVEVLRLARALALADHVERGAERGPDVVVVDARGHHVDQHLVRAGRRGGDDLATPGVAGLAEAVLADEIRVHPLGDFAERRPLTELAEVDHALNSLMNRGSRGSSSPG